MKYLDKVKALLFDLDGTLADTAIINSKAYTTALSEIGVYIDEIKFAQIASGKNWRQFLPAILKSADSAADPTLIAARKSTIYTSMTKDVAINQPLILLLKVIRPQIKTALVTTASQKNAFAILDEHNLRDLFDVIITGDDVDKHKPEPDAYILAIERLQVLGCECIAFEDSEIGIASAKAAGIPVLQVIFP